MGRLWVVIGRPGAATLDNAHILAMAQWRLEADATAAPMGPPRPDTLCEREGRPMRKILVVANQTATNQYLLDAIKGRAAVPRNAIARLAGRR